MTLGPPSSPNKACFRAQIYHCTTLVGKLHGKARALFQNTGDTCRKKGFSKLARLKEAYVNESKLALAMEVFGFFTELSQGNNSLVVFESKLCPTFERFALVGCALPEVLQVMFQVRGLHPECSKLEESLCDGSRK